MRTRTHMHSRTPPPLQVISGEVCFRATVRSAVQDVYAARAKLHEWVYTHPVCKAGGPQPPGLWKCMQAIQASLESRQARGPRDPTQGCVGSHARCWVPPLPRDASRHCCAQAHLLHEALLARPAPAVEYMCIDAMLLAAEELGIAGWEGRGACCWHALCLACATQASHSSRGLGSAAARPARCAMVFALPWAAVSMRLQTACWVSSAGLQ